MISGKAANGAQKGVKRWDFLHDSAHFVPKQDDSYQRQRPVAQLCREGLDLDSTQVCNQHVPLLNHPVYAMSQLIIRRLIQHGKRAF